MKWIVCQLGAREHYAIPRALHSRDALEALITDAWVRPGSLVARPRWGRRLKDRYHRDLERANVCSNNARLIAFELVQRMWGRDTWQSNVARNRLFQKAALTHLRKLARPRRAEERPTPSTTLFAYSYTALELFRYAKEQGWSTVLGQIDPGPEEERIVQKEHQRYASIVSQWKPAPPSYWTTWRKELALADRVIVNSEWSRRCLMGEEGVEGKVEVLPLVYEESFGNRMAVASRKRSQGEAFQLLFLGQINLRKGMGRLLEAMRLLRDEPVELTLAGPTEISPDCWKDLPNVRWVGAVPRSGVSELYRKADAFILPTLSDGFALTQLEARSHGLPLLVSPHCGEVVKGTGDGWVMRDCEVESIVEVIRKAVSQHGERVTGRATTWRESMYSVEALSRRLLGEARR